VIIDPDLFAAASHLNMREHLSGPAASGAQEVELPISETGDVIVEWSAREPLVVAAPRQALEDASLRLAAVHDPDGAGTALLALDFAPFSEAGAFLPLHRPAVAESTATTSPFSLRLTLTRIDPTGVETGVPAAQIRDLVQVRIIEGVLGRLIFALGTEKGRIRRHARELAAQRLLGHTHLDALDRLGADLGVPRFADDLVFRNGEIATDKRLEPDEEYRRRLSLYKPFFIPTRSRLLGLLNGPGENGAANAGPLSGLGLTSRLSLLEDDNEFAVAIHLISAGDDVQRLNFLDHVRRTRLIHPRNDPQANQIHADRFLSSETRQEVQDLRNSLRDGFSFQAGAAIAPMLASVLERLRRCRAALGVATPWPVLRAQDSALGSRYELGLGVDLAAPPDAELNAMRDALANPDRPLADPETESLLASMSSAPAVEDTEGSWLLRACGINTVHRIDSNRIYVSHFSTFGLVITAPSNAAVGESVDLEARYHAQGDPGKNVVLTEGLASALGEWTASGGPAWQVLTDAEAAAEWAALAARAETDPALGVFRAAVLPAITDPLPVVDRLNRVPVELLETIRLAPTQSAAIVAGSPAAIDSLQALVAALRGHGIASGLPLITPANQVLLVVSVIGLPEAGVNLSEKRTSGFRWHVVSIRGSGGRVGSVGSRTSFTPSEVGLYAIVCLGYARRGLTDPYEYRAEMPQGEVLSLRQYEFLMNLLERTHPLGIEVNTYSIRKEHVDLNGDGLAEPLLPAASRTYRAFQRPRYRV
jgi:hypothetical protein